MIWSKFAASYMLAGQLFHSELIFRRYIKKVWEDLYKNKIRYVELRLTFLFPFYRTGKDSADLDYSGLLECFNEELIVSMPSSVGDGFWGARIIWSTLRSLDDDSIQKSMESCIMCKQSYPSLISGFDFVGQEDCGRPLSELLPLCLWFQDRCAELGLEIPFFFHAGECLGDGTSANTNLVDAILLKSRRIVHGFSLYKHPVLIGKVKENSLMIETCPISHGILRLTSSILTHPLHSLLSRGVPVSLNCDDPGLLGHGQCGLTDDILRVFLAFDNIKLALLGTMMENSIRWAAFEDESYPSWLSGIHTEFEYDNLKANRLKLWRIDFELWCQDIIDEFGSKVKG